MNSRQPLSYASMSWLGNIALLKKMTVTEIIFKSSNSSVTLNSETIDRVLSTCKGLAMTFIKHV